MIPKIDLSVGEWYLYFCGKHPLPLTCILLSDPGPIGSLVSYKVIIISGQHEEWVFEKKFLILNRNLCCGYAKEPFHRDGSSEHKQRMFKLIGNKIMTI